MRLYELTGYKENDLYQAMKPAKNWYSKWEHILKAKGFICIGSGALGSVYEHPQLDYCIKIFGKDNGYLSFLRLCQNNKDNPHLPRFRGQLMTIGNKRIIRMEKLKEIDRVGDALLKNFNIEIGQKDYSKPITKDEQTAYEIMIANQPNLLPTLRYICANEHMIGTLDLTPYNIMMREDGTYVITDPYVVH